MKLEIRYAAALALLGGLVLGTQGAAAQEPTTLTVYSTLTYEVFSKYQAAFEAANPDIEISHVHDSGGVVMARLLAERDNPQADVIWDLQATSVIVLADEGLLEPYAPAGLADLDPRLVDGRDPPAWFGYSGYAGLACYNRVEGEKLGIPAPVSWQDLADPIYRGRITMPSPALSGTGLMIVAGFLELMGEEEGWEYLDRLHENIAFYTHGGAKPCKLVGAGEHLVGLSYENAVVQLQADGAPVDIVLPSEGIFWEIGAVAIMRGTDEPEAARRLLDWTASPEAMALYAEDWPIVAMPGMAKVLPGLPDDFVNRLVDSDFEWIAANRERIIAEWERRYGSKTEAE
ncbi:MAG: extracellular solute-binding protein [Dongiaceae bacterium]